MQLYVWFLNSFNLNFKNLVSAQKIEVQGPVPVPVPIYYLQSVTSHTAITLLPFSMEHKGQMTQWTT